MFNLIARAARTYDGRDSVMALYAPIGLLVLPRCGLVMIIAAFTAMFHALGVRGFERAFEMSGSSLFTLGFVRPPDLATNSLAFLEAATGLTVLGLLIAYLPTIYSAFSRREVLVAQLEVRAGNPPSGVHLLVQSQRMERFHLLDDFWVTWQQWFAELEETHTSTRRAQLLPLTAGDTGRGSPRAGRCSTARRCGSPRSTCPSTPRPGSACGRGSSRCGRSRDYYGIPYDPDPHPGDPISITKDEFLEACDELVEAGLPVRADRDAAWLDFTGWRVNYDVPLLVARGVHHGAVRAVVVGPLAALSTLDPAATPHATAARALRPDPRGRAPTGELRRGSRTRARSASGRGG